MKNVFLHDFTNSHYSNEEVEKIFFDIVQTADNKTHQCFVFGYINDYFEKGDKNKQDVIERALLTVSFDSDKIISIQNKIDFSKEFKEKLVSSDEQIYFYFKENYDKDDFIERSVNVILKNKDFFKFFEQRIKPLDNKIYEQMFQYMKTKLSPDEMFTILFGFGHGFFAEKLSNLKEPIVLNLKNEKNELYSLYNRTGENKLQILLRTEVNKSWYDFF